MRIGLISDTHIAYTNEKIPPQVRVAFQGVDLILHAGDIWIPSVLDELETIAPVISAWGDDDAEADFAGDRRMMKGHALELDGIKFWLLHVKPRYALFNPAVGPYSPRPTVEIKEELPQVVIYGHSHHHAIEHYKDFLFVNPGSATFPHYQVKLGTVGIMTTNAGKVDVHLVQLGDVPI